MEYLKAVILGIVQGGTEFLPVSSSGHLVLFEQILDVRTPGYLDILLFHVGTLLATMVFFRHDLVRILGALIRLVRPGGRTGSPLVDDDRVSLRLLGLLAVGSVVTGGLGLLARGAIEPMFDSLLVVGVGLLTTALLLALSGLPRFRSGARGVDRMGILDAVWIGLAQAAALVPGVSRSGTTISVGMFRGLDRETAARYSFLLSIPAILGANLLTWIRLEPANLSTEAPFAVLALGTVAAAVSGWLALGLLLRILTRTTLRGFSYYCAGAGLLALVAHFVRAAAG
jgi:undecaprenyl-diphosphatase